MNCPHCDKPEFSEHCGFCGCRAVVNPDSGNTIYMIRGRVVAAPDDLKDQWKRHHERCGNIGPDPLDLREQNEEPDDADR